MTIVMFKSRILFIILCACASNVQSTFSREINIGNLILPVLQKNVWYYGWNEFDGSIFTRGKLKTCRICLLFTWWNIYLIAIVYPYKAVKGHCLSHVRPVNFCLHGWGGFLMGEVYDKFFHCQSSIHSLLCHHHVCDSITTFVIPSPRLWCHRRKQIIRLLQFCIHILRSPAV